MTLIFATNNKNKVEEIRWQLGDSFEILSLEEAGIDIDIPEPHDTFQANASEKSRTIYHLTGRDCFSEDTGLEIAALNGEPGVKSARYAGDGRNNEDNIDLVLSKLKGVTDRSAQFRTVLSLWMNGVEIFFEGICPGEIIHQRRGSNGFGYDAVFVPTGSTLSFGEMGKEEKVKFSHRAKAMQKMIDFLMAAKT